MTDEQAGDDSILRALMPGSSRMPLPDPALPPAATGGTPLQVTPAVLRTAGRTAGQAGSAAKAVRGRLEQAHHGLGKAAGGFGFAAELDTLCSSWADRLGTLGDDCADIDRLCGLAAKAHEANEIRVVDTMRPAH